LRTLVIGVGNLLRCDDGAGVQVVNRLKLLAPHIDTEDVAMGSVEILEAMKGYDRVIIVDSVVTGAEPGTVFHVNITGGDEPPTIGYSHGVDLVTTLRLGASLYPDEMPGEQIIIGIEAGDITTMSEECTPLVEAAINRVVEEIISIVGC
jgi:hydrogenase maturation protease